MLNASYRFKQLMKAPVKVVRARIVFDNGTEVQADDNLVSITIEQEGQYFLSAAKTGKAVLLGTDWGVLAEERLTIYISAYETPDSEDGEEICYGKFAVRTQSNDLEKGMTTIEFDDSIYRSSNVMYTTGNLTYPATVAELAEGVCNTGALVLTTDMTTLPNYDYVVSEDLWATINNTSYRDIIEQIAGATGTIARVSGANNELEFAVANQEVCDNIGYENLRKVSLADNYGKVSSVVLARTPQEDNIVLTDDTIAGQPAGYNLFDRDNYTFSPYWDDNGNTRDGGSNMKGIVIPCEPNSVYTVLKSNDGTNQRFAVFTTELPPAANVPIIDLVGPATGLNTETQYTISTSSNAHYLYLFLGVADTTPTLAEMIDSICIRKVPSYERINRWHYVGFPKTVNGVTATIDEDGDLVLNGTLTALGHMTCDTDYDITPLLNKTVRMTVKTDGVGKLVNIGTKYNYTASNIQVINTFENDQTKQSQMDYGDGSSYAGKKTLDIYWDKGAVGTVFDNYKISVMLEALDYPIEYKRFEANGIVEVKLANNEILDDDRETLITPIFNAVKGIGYRETEMVTEGHGWYEIGDRIAIYENRAPELPSGYQQVAYIENSAQAYFKLDGFPLTGTSDIEVDCAITGASTDWAGVWSSRTNIGSADSNNTICQISADYLRIDYGANISLSGDFRTTRHKFRRNGRYYYIDGVLKSTQTQKTFENEGFTTIWCTSITSGTNFANNAYGRIYGVKLSDNGVQQLNLTPCVRKSDKKVGLFDTINGVFYESKGSGSFTAGANVGKTEPLCETVITYMKLEISGSFKETLKCVKPEDTETDYATAGSIYGSIWNTEIKVDKQGNEITSIVSRQDQFEDETRDNFTQVVQNISSVVTTIQTTGGGNLVHNSVGYNKDTDGSLVGWDTIGSATSETSPESTANGALSGNQINLSVSSSITQRIAVDSSGSVYTLGFRAKKSVVGQAIVHLRNTIDDYTVILPNGTGYLWEQFSIEGVRPSESYFDVVIETDASIDYFAITDIMLTVGDSITPWVQAGDEILSRNVALDSNGVKVSSNTSNDYVKLDELGLNGYSDAEGSLENVFTINRDLTEVSKLKARKQIEMPPLKIVPITNGNAQGWAFVKKED